MTTEQRPRHLLHAFSTFQLGGPQARFVELANALGPMFRHTVVAMDNRFDAGERLHPSVNWAPMTLKVIKGGALANRASFRQVLRSLQYHTVLFLNWRCRCLRHGQNRSAVPCLSRSSDFSVVDLNVIWVYHKNDVNIQLMNRSAAHSERLLLPEMVPDLGLGHTENCLQDIPQ